MKSPLKNSIILGNSAEIMTAWPDNIIDLTITSPPYDNLRNYEGYVFDFESIAKQLYRITKKGGVVVWVIGDKIKGGRTLTSFRQALFFQEIGFIIHDVMIYQKKNTPFMRKSAYTNAYEMMFVLSKGPIKTFNPLKQKTVRNGFENLPHNKLADGINKKRMGELKKEKTKINIWSYAVGMNGTTSDKKAFQHPAMFPEKLALDHILSWSNEKDLILDPMCGAATTCKMAALNNRSFIGIDISKEYLEIAKERLENYEITIN